MRLSRPRRRISSSAAAVAACNRFVASGGQGLRDEERAYLRRQGRELEPNEPDYRSGFEAALHPATRGGDYPQVVAYVEQCYPEPCKTEVFRIGYERGQDYFRRRMAARETE